MIRALKCPTVLTGLLLILVCLVAKEATGSFVRNDSYEFRGLHALSIHGRDPDHLFLDLGSEADFRRFRFFIKANSQLGPDPQGYWWLNSVEMDINDDGIVEVTTSTQQYYNYTFPEPPNGIQQDHAIRFRMYFTNANNQGTWRTVYITVTVYASPRVYVNTDASTLIQLRDQDCTNRTPVLVVEGLDPANHAYPDVVYGRIAPFVNQALYPSGKEVFVLNFANGGGSMRDNAAVLQDALDAITELCPTKHIAVVGISMGGVITRYALAKAEAESRRHNVGLFISYDSPQVMAHANHGLQDEVRLHPTVGALASIQTLLSSTAAKELLEYNTYDPTSAIHQGFYNELNAYNGDGYPDESYNAAIADGNYGASWPISYVGTDLGTLTAYVEGVWNGSPDIIHVVASATDCASGSLTKISTSQTAVIFPTTLSIPLLPLLFNAYFEASINFDPVIVPTWSALHLVGYGVDPSTGNVSPVGQSKFDATYVQPTRLYHTDFSEGTAEKVLSWLGRSASLTVNYILPEGGTIVADQHTYAILDVASVAIPPKVATINGQQVTYTFSQWDDGSTENPRVLALPHDATRSVIMKVHLASTSSGATSANGQRRMAEDYDSVAPTYHGVYESGGAIWHLRNRRGAGWEQERLLSPLGTPVAHPAIATRYWGHDDQIEVHTAWLEPSGATFMFRSSNIDNGVSWKPIRALPIGCDPSPPLLPNTNSLVWAEGAANGCGAYTGIYYYKRPDSNDSWWPHLVPGTNGNVSLPAVTASATSQYELVFVKDAKVYYVRFTDPNVLDPYTAPQVSAGPIDLTTSGWTATSPAVAMNGATVVIAWTESNGSTSRIAFKERAASGTWSGTTYFQHSGHAVSKPVLGWDYACGSIKLLWECGNHVARASRAASGSSWGAVENVGGGRAPSIAAFGMYSATAMWTSETSAPLYAIELNTSCADVVAPGVCELAPDLWLTSSGVGLEWSAPGDDGAVGTATEYDIRWKLASSGALTEANWYTATSVVGEPTPAVATTSQSHFVGGLSANTWYYVGIRARDEMDNWGPISTVHIKTLTSGGGGGGGASAQNGRQEDLSAVGSSNGPMLAIECDGGSGSYTFRAYRLGAEESAALTASGSTAILGQAQNAAGAWQTASQLSGVAGQVGLVSRREALRRTLFPGGYGLQAIAEHVSGMLGEPLSLSSAVHSRLGPLTEANLAAPVLEPGDVLTIDYAVSESMGEDASDWCLLLGTNAAQGPNAGKQALTSSLPVAFALHRARPNPFSGITAMRFDLPRESSVRIEVLDLQGRVVATLADRLFPAGQHVASWDRRSQDGQSLPAGIYFCRMIAGSFRAQQKMTALP